MAGRCATRMPCWSRRLCRLGLCLALMLSAAVPSAAAVLTRGPYLQLGTPTSIVVRWRTGLATDSRVRFGTEPGNLPHVVDDPTATIEHVVTLQGLLPATTYFYSIGTTQGPLAGGDDHTFTTPPSSGGPAPLRIWVLGDSGTGDGNAVAVRDAFDTWNAGRRLDLWLMLGDNAYNSGTDDEYQTAVFRMYPQRLRTSVLWPTFGNHDGISASSVTQTGPYYDIFTLPKNGEAGGVASGTEAYYSFDIANLHFICLNSHDVDRSPGSPMLDWLASDLAATDAEWTIAFWHHPPYTKGSHDSDTEPQLIEMRQNVLPILEAYGVDLVLSGHSHSYERSFLLDGHYGLSTSLATAMILDGGDGRPEGDGAYAKPGAGANPHEGAVYAVAGSSSRLGVGPLDHPAMHFSIAELGSVVLDVFGRRLDATFLSSTSTVLDTFTLLKAGAGTVLFADGFEAGNASAWSMVVP